MRTFFQNLPEYFRQILAGLRQTPRLRLSSLGKVFSLMGRGEKIALLILLAVGVSGCLWSIRNFYNSVTVPAPDQGGSYSEGVLGQPNYINPVLAYQDTDLALIKLIYSGLYKYDSQGNLLPDLAAGLPQISEDQKQYTVKLKTNVKWHGGRNFKADDVIFTIQTVKDLSFKSPWRSAWASTNVEKIDDFTIKFTTREVSGPFLYNLTLPVLPASLWVKIPAQNFPLSELNLKAVGTGPFSIKEIKKFSSGKLQAISLQSFSNFYAGKPALDEIVIKFYDQPQDLINALHSGEISGFGFVPFDQNVYVDPKREEVRILSLPLPQYQALFFNFGNKNLADIRIRAALNSLVSRQQILDTAFNGYAKSASSLFSFYSGGVSAPAQPDLAKAKNLMEAAGWKKNQQGQWIKNNQALEFNLWTNDFLPNAKAADALATTFRAFGVNINLHILPGKELIENHIRPRDFDLLVYGQKFGADPDTFAFFHSSQTKDPGLNLSGLEDAEADKLLTSARTTTDQQLRMQRYKQLEGLLKDRLPMVFLTQTVYQYVLSKDLKGVSLTKLYDASGRFYDAPNWYMMEKRVWK